MATFSHISDRKSVNAILGNLRNAGLITDADRSKYGMAADEYAFLLKVVEGMALKASHNYSWDKNRNEYVYKGKWKAQHNGPILTLGRSVSPFREDGEPVWPSDDHIVLYRNFPSVLTSARNLLLTHILELYRVAKGVGVSMSDVKVTSWYRPPLVNSRYSSFLSSLHTRGGAVDIKFGNRASMQKVVNAYGGSRPVVAGGEFFFEFNGMGSHWLHVAWEDKDYLEYSKKFHANTSSRDIRNIPVGTKREVEAVGPYTGGEQGGYREERDYTYPFSKEKILLSNATEDEKKDEARKRFNRELLSVMTKAPDIMYYQDKIQKEICLSTVSTYYTIFRGDTYPKLSIITDPYRGDSRYTSLRLGNRLLLAFLKFSERNASIQPLPGSPYEARFKKALEYTLAMWSKDKQGGLSVKKPELVNEILNMLQSEEHMPGARTQQIVVYFLVHLWKTVIDCFPSSKYLPYESSEKSSLLLDPIASCYLIHKVIENDGLDVLRQFNSDLLPFSEEKLADIHKRYPGLYMHTDNAKWKAKRDPVNLTSANVSSPAGIVAYFITRDEITKADVDNSMDVRFYDFISDFYDPY